MFHVELRQFPHNACRFNLTEAQLGPIVYPWVRERHVDFGERKWNPHEARLTILEGPQLEPRELTMGRGWRAAQRDGQDVTARLLSAARDAIQRAEPAPGSGQPTPGEVALSAAGRGVAAAQVPVALADPLSVGVQIAGLLGARAPELLEAWRAAAAASPAAAPSETLAQAEASLRSEQAHGG